MLELYHGLVSTASERARIVLEENTLSWASHPVDLFNGAQHRPEYRAFNRMGQAPTLVHDGFALRATHEWTFIDREVDIRLERIYDVSATS